MDYRFIPQQFIAKPEFEHRLFHLEKLSTDHAELDYEAVMSCHDNLHTTFGEDDPWPPADLTLEDNLHDLKRHADEFDEGRSFTYALLSPDKSQSLGCLYIFPLPSMTYDAQVYYWLRDTVREQLQDDFDSFLRNWLKMEWPYLNPVFPGKDISWDDWEVFLEDENIDVNDIIF